MKKLRRLLSRIRIPDGKPTVGRRLDVQFFGHSGVGKTTLSDAAEKLSMYSWGKMSRLVRKRGNAFSFTAADTDKVYEAILHERWRQTMADTDLIVVRARRMRAAINGFIEDMSWRAGSVPFGCWEDDGVMQRGSIAFMAVRDNGLDYEDFLKDRIYVFLDADADFVLRNVRKRARGTSEYQINNRAWMSDAELLELIERGLASRREFHVFLEAQGLPILKVDARKDIASNAAAVAGFVDSEVRKLTEPST